MANKAKILEYLELVTPILPAPIYWEDVNSILLGGNDIVFKATGAMIRNEYVGKTLFELYPPEMAQHIKAHNEKVMRTRQILEQEESIKDIATGKLKFFTAIKAPLYDEEGTVIGIVGTSIDITDKKEKERLELENQEYKVEKTQQDKFRKVVDQFVHDIRSPLASLEILSRSSTSIPENTRITLRNIATSINDIASNILNQYKPYPADFILEDIEKKQPILLSTLIMQLLSEKRFQFKGQRVRFEYDFGNNKNYFTFINVEQTSLKRSLSNLINNAVDALKKQPGTVTLSLNCKSTEVHIIVKDSGSGIAKHVKEKILNSVAVTADKEDGHGIGLTQVHDMLRRNLGKLSIESTIGKGTKMVLTFVKCETPNWITNKVHLYNNDTVIVLDDDNSIHGAWDAKFKPILKQNPNLQVKHYTSGIDTINYINSLSTDEKQRVFILSDHELLKQNMNGLDIIEQLRLKRVLLVTSHYDSHKVRARATSLEIKILPKMLAAEISIEFIEASNDVGVVTSDKECVPIFKPNLSLLA